MSSSRGDTLMSSHDPAGRLRAEAIAASRVASSSSAPMPTGPGVREHHVGALTESNLVSASYPMIPPDSSSTIGWKTERNARAASIASKARRRLYSLRRAWSRSTRSVLADAPKPTSGGILSATTAP